MSRFTLLVLTLAMVLVGGIVLARRSNRIPSASDARRAGSVGCSQVATEYREHASGSWLTMSATVTRLLPDAYGAFQHQRFIVQCPSGQTVLIVNDVSVGQRVPVRPGDVVVVHGEYVWNRQGGLIHYTHQGSEGGWILERGHVYAVIPNVPGQTRLVALVRPGASSRRMPATHYPGGLKRALKTRSCPDILRSDATKVIA